MIFIVVYVSACFGLVAHFAEIGAVFKVSGLKLNGDAAISEEEAGMTNLALVPFRASMGVTALAMLISFLCAVYVRCGFVTPTHIHPSDLVQINIPFSTLNFAIALGIVVTIVLNALWVGVGGSFMTAVLTSIFLSNKKAKKHVALRLRQLIDRFTVGRNNSVGPLVSIALVARAQVADSPPLFTRRWAEPSVRYAVALPEFLDIMDVTETSM